MNMTILLALLIAGAVVFLLQRMLMRSMVRKASRVTSETSR